MVILIRTHTKKYTKGDSIKKFFAGYVGWLTRTICTKIGDNWINGTGNIDRFVFPTPSLLENKMRKNVFSVQKWLIWGENKRIFPGGMNKITFHQLNQRFSVSISVRRELPIGLKKRSPFHAKSLFFLLCAFSPQRAGILLNAFTVLLFQLRVRYGSL